MNGTPNFHHIETPNEPAVRGRPHSRCIYCLRTPDAGTLLTDEHVIPLGIRGNLVLPSASCHDCAKVINLFESRFINGNCGMVRSAQQLGSKRRRGGSSRKRDQQFFASRMPWDGDTIASQMENDSRKHPANLTELLYFGLICDIFDSPIPGILQNHPHDLFIPWKSEIMFLSKEDLTDQVFSVGAKTYSGTTLKVISKIAHGFLSYHLGRDQFEPFLIPSILGDTANHGYFIGTITNIPPGEKLHEIKITNVITLFSDRNGDQFGKLLMVRVRLFSKFGAPEYAVIAGRAI